MKTQILNLALIFSALMVLAIARPAQARVEAKTLPPLPSEESQSILHTKFNGVFGDRWQMYLSGSVSTTTTGVGDLLVVQDGDEDGLVEFGTAQMSYGSIGYLITAYRTRMALQISLGYQYSYSQTDIGAVTRTSIPIEIIPFYQWNNHRLGGGISQHMNASINIDSVVEGVGVVGLDSPMGMVVEYGYRWPKKDLWIGARYQMLNFKPTDKITDVYLSEIDNSHFGLTLHFGI